jgi:ATP-dependent protease ClpP protease subunit
VSDAHVPEPLPEKAASQPFVAPTRTSMFEAIHAARYERQQTIRKIDQETGRQLICYVSGRHTHIHRDDVVFFADLLERIPNGSKIDLLLHTPGGDMDVSEKMVSMIRSKTGDASFRVIVPDFAKSSGTLITIGGDVALMSDTSELGPIDPQITVIDGHGNRVSHSVQALLDAYESYSKALKEDPGDMASQLMLNKLDPGTLKLCESAKQRARKLAEKHLQRGMLQSWVGPFTYTAVADNLLDTKKWYLHSQVIGPDDAKTIGLNVETADPYWSAYWKLYCRQRLAITSDQLKLFESHYVSHFSEN